MSARLETSDGEKMLTCVNNKWKTELSSTTGNYGAVKLNLVFMAFTTDFR